MAILSLLNIVKNVVSTVELNMKYLIRSFRIPADSIAVQTIPAKSSQLQTTATLDTKHFNY